MTLNDILKGALKTDLYELLIWSTWYFRETRVSCKECVERKAEGSGKIPDCVTCGLPTAKLIRKFLEKETENVQTKHKSK